jgi:hypothetical protein
VVELPFAADRCPWVEKLRTALPLTVGIRDGAVQLVSALGGVVRGEGTRTSASWPRVQPIWTQKYTNSP